METFFDIINGDKPVLIDFFATWCGPCKMLSPTIQSVGEEMAGKARVLKIDIDRNQPLARQYGIQSVPTLMIFKAGKLLWRQSGAMDKNSLIKRIEEFV
jgi:thioredoxin 1